MFDGTPDGKQPGGWRVSPRGTKGARALGLSSGSGDIPGFRPQFLTIPRVRPVGFSSLDPRGLEFWPALSNRWVSAHSENSPTRHKGNKNLWSRSHRTYGRDN